MKKKMFLMIILAMVLCYVPSVFAANITGCENVIPGAAIDAKIANVVHTVILLIQIAVPIILVIAGSIDLLKATTAAKEDEITKGRKMLVKRLITAALVFFIIAIVKLLVSFVAGAGESKNILDCFNCFINGTEDYAAGDSTVACK